MPYVPKRTRSRIPYWVRFSLTIVALALFTSAFVLVVLPQRFVLQAGLIESGITFPTSTPPFLTPPRPRIVQPRPPTPPPIQPGPAEQFWNAILPLLRAGKLEKAVPQFRLYLASYPDDHDISRELAVVLTRLGRFDEAERIYRRLRSASGDPKLTLQLARLLRDRGDLEGSLGLYHVLLDAQPDDDGLLREYAQVLTWAEQYSGAAEVYRRLLEREPTAHELRLSLAKVLYWDGQQPEALAALDAIPPEGANAAAAALLRTTLENELAEDTPPETPLDRARRAVVAGELDEANRLYQLLLELDPGDADLWREWADFLQYQKEDLSAARDALTRLATLRDLTWDERYRLAQLHAWTGDEPGARSMLVRLLQEDSVRAEGWTLLGDLYRFDNARIQAHRAYRSALRLDPQSTRALEGQRELERQTAELIGTRERRSVGPEMLYFRDSDDFERWDLGVRASFLWGNAVVVTRAGYRTLDGIGLAGTAGSERGPYFELQLAKWWRLGTIRTSVTAGVEQLDAVGTEPTFGVRVAVPDAGGTTVEVAYDHGPAFHRTVTLESVLGSIRSDHLQTSVYRHLGTAWSLAGQGAVTSLRGSGTDNWRVSGFLTLRRQIAMPLSLALTSQFLAFASPAPIVESRRLYWDPQAFWAGGLQFEARSRSPDGWDLYGRVTPGLGLVRERLATGFELVPQLATEAGAAYDSRRFAFSAGLGYLRGREGRYNSFGANASLGVKY